MISRKASLANYYKGVVTLEVKPSQAYSILYDDMVVDWMLGVGPRAEIYNVPALNRKLKSVSDDRLTTNYLLKVKLQLIKPLIVKLLKNGTFLYTYREYLGEISTR